MNRRTYSVHDSCKNLYVQATAQRQSLLFFFLFQKARLVHKAPPRNHKAAGLFLTVDFVSAHPGAQITLKPGFATALQIAKGRAYPAPT